MSAVAPPTPAALKRSVGPLQLTLYGLGVTIGAGIYVLIGAAAGYAGYLAPIAFIVAALVIAPTAGSFAELSVRFPVSAGEAAYVQEAFGYRSAALVVGLMVAAVGLVSSAALAHGAIGYLGVFVDVPRTPATVFVIVALGAVAAWGISESMALAAVLTLIEIGGLIAVVATGVLSGPADPAALDAMLAPDWSADLAVGILAAAMLGFFAFLGFEDIVNIAEESRVPGRTMPIAIFATLAITTVLYVAVAAVAVTTVAPAELARAEGPLALVFERTGAGDARIVAAIAVGATVNGILIQMLMASRVVYGLARLGRLPAPLARVHPLTHTPLVATGAVVGVVIVLAVALPLVRLAEITSSVALVNFLVVNAALIRLKVSGAPAGDFSVPLAVPVCGFVLCLVFLVIQAARIAGF